MHTVLMPFLNQSWKKKREVEEVLMASIFVERSDMLSLELENKELTREVHVYNTQWYNETVSKPREVQGLKVVLKTQLRLGTINMHSSKSAWVRKEKAKWIWLCFTRWEQQLDGYRKFKWTRNRGLQEALRIEKLEAFYEVYALELKEKMEKVSWGTRSEAMGRE